LPNPAIIEALATFTVAARKLLSSTRMACHLYRVLSRKNQTFERERRPGVALAVFAAFLSYACGGCLSNEYVIPQVELARLAQLPPEQRGQRVAVVQELGDRRSLAIDTSAPTQVAPTPENYRSGSYGQGEAYGSPPGGYVEDGPQVQAGVGIVIIPGPPLGTMGPPPAGYAGRPWPGPRGPTGTLPGRVPPTTPRKPGGPNAGGIGNIGKGGGGGGKGEDLAVFLVVMAVLATIGLVATEGVRYDGSVAVYPWQPVHLKGANGQEREIPLAQVSALDMAATTKAVVMDDEGWGIMRLGRRSLDRRGFTFKMDLGAMVSSCSCLSADGVAANIQFGYFPHHRLGLLAGWSPAGGSDSDGKSFYRHNIAFEAQAFPLDLWRLHLGGFGHAGVQYASDASGGTRNGMAFGGGLTVELSLTARLALTARADYTAARVAPDGQGWAGAEMFTAGVAVY